MANMNQSTEYILNIIRAALPYVNSRTRNGMEAAIKTGELAETFQSMGDAPDLAACDLGNEAVDVEGLLLSVQNVCAGPEKEMVNTALNFYKTRNLYESYQVFRQQHLQPELQAASVNGASGSKTANNTMLDFLMTQLSPEQKSTFDAMNMLMNSGGFGNLGNMGNFNLGNFMKQNSSKDNNSNK